MKKSKGVVMGLGITLMLILFAGIIHAEDVALEKGSYVFRIEQDEGNIVELDAEVLEVVDGLLIDMRLPDESKLEAPIIITENKEIKFWDSSLVYGDIRSLHFIGKIDEKGNISGELRGLENVRNELFSAKWTLKRKMPETPSEEATISAETGADPQTSLKSTIDHMIELLENQEYRTLIEKYLHPEDLEKFKKDPGLEVLVAAFAERNAQELLEVLKILQKLDRFPEQDPETKTVTFDLQDHQDPEFIEIEGLWYLFN